MRYSSVIVILLTICSQACSQDSTDDHFVESFAALPNDESLEFALAAQNGKLMTRDEALKYVYSNDTSRLYCVERIINMDAETDSRIARNLYMPEKCFAIKNNGYTAIAYTSYDCKDQHQLPKKLLTLKTIREAKVIDSLIVYSATEYGAQVNGLINPKSGKIFLVGTVASQRPSEALLYSINAKGNFQIIEVKPNVRIRDNLDKLLTELDWSGFEIQK
jgi:hypothetical protein